VINDPTLLLNVITGDESIVYAYDPDTKLQSSQWKSTGSPRTKKVCMEKSKLKTILICFFDQEGIVYRKFVPPGVTVNANFYCDVLRRLRENFAAHEATEMAKPEPHYPPRQCLGSQVH